MNFAFDGFLYVFFFFFSSLLLPFLLLIFSFTLYLHRFRFVSLHLQVSVQHISIYDKSGAQVACSFNHHGYEFINRQIDTTQIGQECI